MKGKIAEVFESVQGEGVYLGESQIFVRFYGCNISCRFCDTRPQAFFEYDPQELHEEIKLYCGRHHSISFTGGEPLLQKDFLKEILKITAKQGHKNYLETNGTLPEALSEVIGYVDIVAMDLKLPSSTGLNNFWDLHRRFLKIASLKEVFLKSVVRHDTKDEDISEAINLIQEAHSAAVFVLQPDSYDNNRFLAGRLEELRQQCVKENVTTCVIPQMHKKAGWR